MKIIFVVILRTFGVFAILSSVFQVMAKDHSSAFWSLLYGVVFVELSRLLTERAVDGAVRTPKGGEYKIEWVDADTIRLTPRN